MAEEQEDPKPKRVKQGEPDVAALLSGKAGRVPQAGASSPVVKSGEPDVAALLARSSKKKDEVGSDDGSGQPPLGLSSESPLSTPDPTPKGKSLLFTEQSKQEVPFAKVPVMPAADIGKIAKLEEEDRLIQELKTPSKTHTQTPVNPLAFDDSDDPIGGYVKTLVTKATGAREKQRKLLEDTRNVSESTAQNNGPLVIKEKDGGVRISFPHQQEEEEAAREVKRARESAFESGEQAKAFLHNYITKSGKKVLPNPSANPVTIGGVPVNPTPMVPDDLDKADMASLAAQLPKDNLTLQTAFQKYFREHSANEILKNVTDAESFEDAAVKLAGVLNPAAAENIKRITNGTNRAFDLRNGTDAYAGRLISDALNEPAFKEWAQKTPQALNVYRQVSANLYNNYPSFAKTVVGAKVAQKLEDERVKQKGLSGLSTDVSVDNVDRVADEILTPQEKLVYEKYNRPFLGMPRSLQNVADRVAFAFDGQGSPSGIATTNFVENFGVGATAAATGMEATARDIVTKIAPKGLVMGEGKRISQILQHNFSAATVNPASFWGQIKQQGGNTTGYVATMIGAGAIAKGLGINALAGENIANFLSVEGPNAEQSVVMYPDSPVKQYLAAALGTGIDMVELTMIGGPIKRAGAGLNSLVKNSEVSKVIDDFTDGKITGQQAKNQLLPVLGKAILNTAKDNAKISAVNEAGNLLHATVDSMFGGRKVDMDEEVNTAFQNFKVGLLSNTLISGLGAYGHAVQSPKLNGSIVRELANNAEGTRLLIEQQALTNPELAATKDERIRNLNEAELILKDVEGTDLTDAQKEKFLVNKLAQKVWERKAEAATTEEVKRAYEAKAKEQAKITDAIYKGEDTAPEHEDFNWKEKIAAAKTEEEKAEIDRQNAQFVADQTRNKNADTTTTPQDEAGVTPSVETSPDAAGRTSNGEVVPTDLPADNSQVTPDVISPETTQDNAEIQPTTPANTEATPAETTPAEQAPQPDDDATSVATERPPVDAEPDADPIATLSPEEKERYAELLVDDKMDEAQALLDSKKPATSKSSVAEEGGSPKAASEGVRVTDAKAVESVRSKFAPETKQHRIINQATAAVNTLKSVLPDFDIHLHDSDDSYNSAVTSENGKAGTAGNFSYRLKEGGGYSGRIDINLNKANLRTVAHEVSHGVMLQKFGDNPLMFKRFRDRVSGIVSQSTNKKLNEFASKYSDEGDVQHEEYLAELSGALTAASKTLDPKDTVLQKIAAVINNMVSAVTGGKIKPFGDFVKNSEVADFFNTMSSAIRQGKPLSAESTASTSTDGIISKSQKSTPIEERRAKLKEMLDKGHISQDKYNELLKRLEGQQTPPNAPQATSSQETPQKPTSSIKNAATAAKRAEFGILGSMPEEGRRSREVVEREADSAIQNGYNIKKLIDDIHEEGGQLSDTEGVILGKYIASKETRFRKLSAEIEAAAANGESLKEAIDKREVLAQQLNDAYDATKKAGTAQGRGLASRRWTRMEEDSLANMIIRKAKANRINKLSASQLADVTRDYNELKAAKDKADEKLKKLVQENARLKAARVVQRQKSVTPKASKSVEDFKKERLSIVEGIKEKLAKLRGGDKPDSDYTGEAKQGESKSQATEQNKRGGATAKELRAISTDVRKLMRSLVEEGVTKHETVVNNIHTALKEGIPEITKQDVNDILAGEYSKKKPTRNELAARQHEITQQSKLINKLEKLMAGPEPKTEAAQNTRTREIERLQEQIKGLRKEHRRAEAALKAQATPPKVKRTKEQIALDNLKKRYREQTAALQARIDKGDYTKAVKPEPLKLDKEAVDLREAYLKKHAEFNRKIIEDDFKSRGWMGKDGKLLKTAKDVTGLGRVLQTAVDVSMLGRQGWWGMIRQLWTLPIGDNKDLHVQKQLAVQVGRMYSALASAKNYRKYMDEIHRHPRYQMAQDMGLKLQDPESKDAIHRDDTLGPSIADRIPGLGKPVVIKGKEYGAGITKASENAATMLTNQMKWDIFNNLVDQMEASGKTADNNPKDFKAAAIYANNAVGRGHLPKKLEQANAVTSALLYSVRFQASRLQLLTNWANPFFLASVPPEVRKAHVEDTLKFVATGMAICAIAKHAFGAEVELDAASSDFGKIKIGETRYDVWAGFTQYATIIAQTLRSEKKPVGAKAGEMQPLGTGYGQTGVVENIGRFARGKTAPLTGAIINSVAGERMDKSPTNVLREAKLYFVPMVAADATDLFSRKDASFGSNLLSTALVVHGVGVRYYDPEEYKKIQAERKEKAKELAKKYPKKKKPKKRKVYD